MSIEHTMDAESIDGHARKGALECPWTVFGWRPHLLVCNARRPYVTAVIVKRRTPANLRRLSSSQGSHEWRKIKDSLFPEFAMKSNWTKRGVAPCSEKFLTFYIADFDGLKKRRSRLDR
jgi:hypothetical protein